MKFGKHLGILFLFVIVASSLFATVSEKPRQGLVSIFEDLQPASEARESVSDTGVQPLETVTPRHANQFTGRRLDSFTGQYFNRHRYYQPKYGRFISRDPIRFNGGLNLWTYANNNPVRFRDPTGRIAVPIVVGGLTGIAALYELVWANHCWKTATGGSKQLLASNYFTTDKQQHCYSSCYFNLCMGNKPSITIFGGIFHEWLGAGLNFTEDEYADIMADMEGILQSQKVLEKGEDWKDGCAKRCKTCPSSTIPE